MATMLHSSIAPNACCPAACIAFCPPANPATPPPPRHTRFYGRDFDQIASDVAAAHARAEHGAAAGTAGQTSRQQKLLSLPLDPDLPGDGQFYCIPCARHFQSHNALAGHKKTKGHKKQLKLLRTVKPYTQAEAELASR